MLLFLCSVARAQTDPRGLYVYSWEVANAFSPTQANAPGVTPLLTALDTAGIDGVTLVIDWSVIEPAKGTFMWTNATPGTTPLDLWIREAIIAGKRVNLAIRAGFGTPCWLFNPGDCPPGYRNYVANYNGTYAHATALNLYASAHQGNGKCQQVIMAAPWDNTFLQEWDKMLANLSTYLRSTKYNGAPEYDAVAIVRITGMNRTTDEFRIPAEILSTQHGAGCDTNSVQTWLDAGYRPSLLFSAWDQLSDDIVAHFGDKYVNVPIIPTNSGTSTNVAAGNGQFPFPPIDETQCVYLAGIPVWARSDFSGVCTIAAGTPVPDQNRDLIARASQKIPGKFSVEFENLHFAKNGKPAPAEPTVVSYAENLGTMPAYQPNDYFAPFPTRPGGTSCTSLANPERCSPAQYLEMLESGIAPDSHDAFLRSQFIEIFFPDIIGNECLSIKNPPAGCGYPDEIAVAHADLVDPPVVTVSFPAPSAATHWYTSRPVVGQVTASSAIKEPIVELQCSGAATGSGAGGFAISVKKQGSPEVVSCQAKDAAGHMGESIRALWIDTIPPVTTASVSFFQTGKLSAARVTLNATDNLSGVAETQYRIDSGAWTTGTVFNIETLGTHTVQFRSADVAGNVESTKSTTVTVVITPPCKGNTCV